VPAAEVYADATCKDEAPELDPQLCADAIRSRPAGAITQPFINWVNRPTFQQAIEIRK
jgi:hypothetical protein